MRRKLVFGTFMAVVLAAIVSAACVTPAFAVTTLIDHQSTVGFAYIDVPGHNTAVITFAHFDWGDHGVGDSIGIWVLGPLGALVPIAFFRDSESTYNWAKEFYKFTPALIQLVKCYQLQVYRMDKIAIAIWTFPIIVPEETWGTPPNTFVTRAVTIPPGCLILRGYDGVKTGTEIMKTPPSGWATTNDWIGFDAYATFVCPSWHYFGPVGLGEVCWVHESTLTQTHP